MNIQMVIYVITLYKQFTSGHAKTLPASNKQNSHMSSQHQKSSNKNNNHL